MPARILVLGDALVVTAIHARTPCGTDADGCRSCICRLDVPIRGPEATHTLQEGTAEMGLLEWEHRGPCEPCAAGARRGVLCNE
jgi:hypothetical protein